MIQGRRVEEASESSHAAARRACRFGRGLHVSNLAPPTQVGIFLASRQARGEMKTSRFRSGSRLDPTPSVQSRRKQSDGGVAYNAEHLWLPFNQAVLADRPPTFFLFQVYDPTRPLQQKTCRCERWELAPTMALHLHAPFLTAFRSLPTAR